MQLLTKLTHNLDYPKYPKILFLVFFLFYDELEKNQQTAKINHKSLANFSLFSV